MFAAKEVQTGDSRIDMATGPSSKRAWRAHGEHSRGTAIMDNDRIARITRRFTSGLPRRTAIAMAFGASSLPWLAASRDGEAKRRKRRNRGPGPDDPCSKLGGKCAFNGDCCGPRTRCKKAGNGKCRCKRDSVPCAGICCPTGQACCGRCADLQTDADNCGACFAACGADETCVAGSCTS